MIYSQLDQSGNVVGSGNTAGGGGSGLTWFQNVGTAWTTNSSTSRKNFLIVINNDVNNSFAQLSQAFTMPYAGALRNVTCIQNGPTSAAGSVILQRSTNGGSSFNDWLTLNNFIAAVNAYNSNSISYSQNNAATQLNAGDLLMPLYQYSATGVNQSSTLTLTFACPGVT